MLHVHTPDAAERDRVRAPGRRGGGVPVGPGPDREMREACQSCQTSSHSMRCFTCLYAQDVVSNLLQLLSVMQVGLN